MNDPEAELLRSLTAASLPLPLQLACAIALLGGYWAWTRLYYAAVDPRLRRGLGRLLGTSVVWVLRHSASYQTPLELGLSRARVFRWTWGIASEHERTVGRDAAALFAWLVGVGLAAGTWPIALFLLATLRWHALSYVVFLPGCVAMVAIYSVFWTGRYPVPHRA